MRLRTSILFKVQAADRKVLSAAITRICVIVPSLVGSLIATRLIVSKAGVATYAFYALTSSMLAVLPVNDLGLGGAVIAASASYGPSHELQKTVAAAARILFAVGATTAALAVVLAVGGGWSSILAVAGTHVNLVLAIALTIYSVSFVPALGSSVLVGAMRTNLVIAAQLIVPLSTLLMVGIVLASPLPNITLAIIPAAATLSLALAVTSIATHLRLINPRVIAGMLTSRKLGVRLRDRSLPTMIILLAAPLALQSDRVVLSHVSGAADVARYSIAAQLFGPLFAVVASASQPLWPQFESARAGRGPVPNLRKVVTGITVLVLIVGLILCGLSGLFSDIVTGGKISISWPLRLGYLIFAVAQGVSYPTGQALTTPLGLRFQAGIAVASLLVNLPVSIVLAAAFGSAGPIVGSAATMALLQIPANVYLIRRRVHLDGGNLVIAA